MSEPSLDLAFRMIAEHLARKTKISNDGFTQVRINVIRQMDIAFCELVEEQGHTDEERAAFLGMNARSYPKIKHKIAQLKGQSYRRTK